MECHITTRIYPYSIKVLALCSVLLVVNVMLAQDKALYTELASADLNSGDEDLRKLDRYFENVQIVGLGEATHGTHEFSTMRHRIFQYLVNHHNFNTMFLEADYATCLRVNSYINGSQDNVYDALDEIDMWPWLTTEMVDLVNWMREYNAKNEGNKLSFIGVDAQRFSSTLLKIDYILEKYHFSSTDTSLYAPLSDTEFWSLKKKKNLAPYHELLIQKEEINTQSFSEEDKTHYAVLVRHFRQIIEMQSEKKSYGQSQMRDNNMAINMLQYINAEPGRKAIFWAHNGHIFNLSLKDFGSDKWVGSAGGFLKETIGNKYYSLGFDFDEGIFNAYYPDANSDIELENEKYTLGAVSVGPSADGTLAANFRELNSPVFIDYSQIQGDEYIYMNHIGATYLPKKENDLKSTLRYNVLGNKTSFDAMILIKHTTATHLLRNEKPKTLGD